eukprot:6757156-Heterocapsa_arctica.AAC.1
MTDNQSVRDAAHYLAAGGVAHKGRHSDLWNIIKQQIAKMGHIRWVKAHLRRTCYCSTSEL